MFNGSYGFFGVVFVVHIILLVLDKLVKLWSPSYTAFHERYGIDIQLFHVKWFTTVFNRCIQKVGTWRPKFQKTWFSTGMWITLFALPFAVYFVVQSTCVIFIKVLRKESKFDTIATPFLEPAVPGINIPVSDLGYYVSTLLICSVFHELGHAIAAVREGVHINGVGVFVLFIVPVAYVRMEGLEGLTSSKQLRILCAGVWHNIVLALGAVIVIFLLPTICYPFYEYGTGIQVISIHKNSPLQKTGGLKVSDIVHSVNDCPVYNQNTWIKCLQQAVRNPTVGYCIDSEFIHNNDETVQVRQVHNVVECCKNETLSEICFEYLEQKDIPLELPQYSCLKARAIVDQSKGTCYSSDDCPKLHCFRPCLPNGTKLIEIQRRDQNNVLFLGHPMEVLQGVHISEFIKLSYLSTSVPDSITKFCNFIIMFSGALATLNSIPCFHFDGQYITRILVNVSLAKSVRFKSVRLAISLCITVLGSSVLVLYTFLIFFSMFF